MILIEKTTPIHASQIRPHWYDSEEENSGSEYDTESEDGGGDEGWTGEDVWYFIEDYLGGKFVCQDEEYLEDGKMVLGTCSIYLNDEITVGCVLDIAGYYKYDAIYAKYFGLLNRSLTDSDHGVPYDIMKVYCVPVKINNYEFIQKRAIIKTYWLRLVQRHWKNRTVGNQKLRGLLSCYSKSK